MPLIVEDGTSLTDADSYLSVADADAYHAAHGNPSAWSSASMTAKENALRSATDYLDVRYNGRWDGRKKTQEQSLAWPRCGAYDAEDYLVDDNVVPIVVKSATAEAALRALSETLMPDIAAPGASVASESVRVGSIQESISYVGGGKSSTNRYPKIDRLLVGLITAPGTVQRA